MNLISPNIRPACGQQQGASRIYMGGCFQNFDENIAHIKIKKNVTLEKDYASGSGYLPNGIDPYPRGNQDGPGGGAPFCSDYWDDGCCGCLGGYCCGGETGGTGTGCVPVGLPAPSDIMPCRSGTSSFSDGLGQYHNCYVQTNETKSFASCRNIGWKNAYAYKTHYGRPSYTSRMAWQTPDYIDFAGCGCSYHNYDGAPDTTRYLSMAANSSWTRTNKIWCINVADGGTYDCGDGPQPNCCTSLGVITWTGVSSGNAQNSVHVDKYSGNLYVDSCSSGSTTYSTIQGGCDTSGCVPDPPCDPCNPTAGTQTARDQADIDNSLYQNAAEAFALLSMTNGNVMDIGSLFSIWSCIGCDPMDPDCKCTVSGGGNAWTITTQIRYYCSDNACDVATARWVTIQVISINYSSGQADYIQYEPNMHGYLGCPSDGYCIPYDNYYHRHLSISATTYVYTEDYVAANSVSVWTEGDTTVNGSLGTPYTAAQVYDDAVALLAHLPLDRDDLLPWRVDGNLTTGPLVHYEEFGGGSPTVGSCESQTSSLASGYIYGIPGPSGIDHVFNPGHWNYCVCTDAFVVPPNTCQYNKEFGQWNDIIGGGSATEFTNGYEASNIPPYAFASNYTFMVVPCSNNSSQPNGNYVGNTLWLGKYAEIIFPKQSFNYARPCGQDRFNVSESTSRCITDWTGGTLALEPLGPQTDIKSGELVWVCGTGDYDGCWKVTSDLNYTITLTEPRLISASLADTTIVDCGSGMVSRMAYQGASKLVPAGICGRLGIQLVSAPSASMPCTLSLSDNAYLVDNDDVVVTAAIGGGINGSWKVKVLAPDQIVLVGSKYSPTPLYLGAGQIYCPAAADWRWDDTLTKMDFSAVEWMYDYRKSGEYQRLVDSAAWNAGSLTATLNDQNCCLYSCDTTCPSPAQIAEPNPNSCYGRDLASVTCTTHCVPYSACNAAVAFYSPNGETFKSNSLNFTATTNLGFPRVTMDEQYGTLWQGVVRQTMLDPLYLPPPCACGTNTADPAYLEPCPDCSYRSDNGTCQADQAGDPDLGIPCIKYYPAPGIFEARCEVPPGAPTSPMNTVMGCLKVTDTDCNKKPYCSAPYWSGNNFLWVNYPDGCNPSVYPTYLPWDDYLNRYNCVCADGRFALQYSENGIVCEDPFTLPP